jgi:3-mercaptopyruvate sulfurtransferase SseA
MTNNSRTWLLVGLIGLIVVGAMLILLPSITRPPTSKPRPIIPTAPPLSEQLPYPDVPRVTVSDAYAAHEAGQVIFVDVRDRGSYDQAHVPGARSIPSNELESRLNELDKNHWIILYCT